MTLLANGDAYYEEISKTFLLFGDPAMALKVPIPRRPDGLAAQQQGMTAVALSWNAADDADGNPVAGYNLYRRPAADGAYSIINTALVADNGFVDESVTLGTRYYYVVRAVDGDGTESVDSESVSIVLSAPVTALSGSGSGGGGGGGCFISSAQEAFNQDIMQGLAFLGIVVLLWRLIMRIKARRRESGSRSQSPLQIDENPALDETMDLGFRVMTVQNSLMVSGTDDRVGKENKVSTLSEETPGVVDSSPY
jgi:hypothetical protein